MLKIFKFAQLRKKLLFTLLIIVVFRLFAHIPVPGVDTAAIRAYLSSNVFFGLFDLFSGGGFQNFSIVTLGLAPYINASIIIQLLTMMIPSLEELQKEGEYGRERINMYTKLLGIPLALVQSYGIYFLLSRQGIITPLGFFDLVVLLLSLIAGSSLLVWIGDLVTEYGVGNGISLLIFISIISRLPQEALKLIASISSVGLWPIVSFGILALIVIMGVVLVNEGTRNVNLEYGRRGTQSQKVTNFLPIKVNQAGVIPIIFAVSLVSLPSLIGGPLSASAKPNLAHLGSLLAQGFNTSSFGYNILYFLLVVGFTFFYTSIQFDPEKIADDIKKRGGFIPGVRPGKTTADFLKKIVNRITLAGAIFLGLIAILPYILQSVINIGGLSIGGTGLLIVVSVVLETVRQVESLMVTRSYDKYLM